MKKLLSVILILIFVFISVSQGFVVFAEDDKNNTALYTFADDLLKVIRENSIEDSKKEAAVIGDVMFKMDRFLSNFKSSTSIYDNVPDDAFETKRLIVKSKKLYDYQGAVDCVKGYNDLYVLQYDSQLSAKKAYEYYLDSAYIEYVEPDIIYSSQEDIPVGIIPGEEANEFDEVVAATIQWLSDKIGFSDIKEELAERIENDYVLVAVLDSGVDTDHELLANRLVDSDVNLSGSGNLETAEDDYGHGTHVAGIIANYTLSNVKIKPYKVLNSEGKGSLSTIAIAVDMAVADGADIINMSLSGKKESPTLTDAVNNAVANDINVVVAAGNSSLDMNKNYVSPACIESAITVSATDENDNLASFSNYNGSVDIAAPGVNIKSSYLNNTYVSLNGTSMAAPQVVAGLAILKSLSIDIDASKCEEIIKDFAIKVKEVNGENRFGSGIIFLKYLLDGKPTTSNPVFSVDSCSFEQAFTVEITCPDKEADIYYIIYDTDWSSVNWFDSFKYSNPITVSVDAKISAIAVLKGCIPSSIVTVEYDRTGQSEEDYYEINALGYITGYYGSDTDIVVPDVIKDKKVKGVGIGAFMDNKKIQNVVLPDSCTKINASAFKNCSSLTSVSGMGIDEISINAFENSSVKTIDFPNLKTIGSYAFSGCLNLNSITLSNVESINSYAFKGTASLGVVICDNLTSLGTEVFNQSGVILFSAPKLTSIGTSAFLDCYDLISVSMPVLTVLNLSTFKNCTSLKNVEFDSLTEIKANALRNTAIEIFEGENVEIVGNYVFADNPYLTVIVLPKAKSTGAYVFQNCTSLQIVHIPLLEELSSSTFAKCESLSILNLPSVTDVSKNVFKDSSVEYLLFDKVEKIEGLPDTLKGILLPENTTSITAVPKNKFTVYGFENTYAFKYATDNNKEFKTVPVILDESSSGVTVEDEYIVVYAFGFDCYYQWYRNDIVSNIGGTPIEGATSFYFKPSPDDNCEAYYCVITSSHNGYTSINVTSPIVNADEYRRADYSKYNMLKAEIYSLNRSLYDDELLRQLDEFSNVDMSGLKFSQQEILDNYVNQLKELLTQVKDSFVLGDINLDGKVSAIDARIVLLVTVNIQELSGKQVYSADMDGNGEVTAVDARMILQKVVE